MWLYNNTTISSIEETPENSIGFIYKITCTKTGKFYIGKKNLYSTISKPLTKKELSEYDKPGKKPTKKKVTKESDWKTYLGSSKEFKQYVKDNGSENFTKEILQFCKSKKSLTLYEIIHIIKYNCLESELSFNDNILGKFFKKDLE